MEALLDAAIESGRKTVVIEVPRNSGKSRAARAWMGVPGVTVMTIHDTDMTKLPRPVPFHIYILDDMWSKYSKSGLFRDWIEMVISTLGARLIALQTGMPSLKERLDGV